jgi:hypothetical protein
MAERLKAAVLRLAVRKPYRGYDPSPSAIRHGWRYPPRAARFAPFDQAQRAPSKAEKFMAGQATESAQASRVVAYWAVRANVIWNGSGNASATGFAFTPGANRQSRAFPS